MKLIHACLFAALAAAAAAGGAQSFASSTPSAAALPPAAPLAEMPAMEQPAAESAAGAAITGEVLEVIQVPNYSYLRVGAKGQDGSWVAVPTSDLGVGDAARVGDAMQMTNFTSTALKRTFPVIYFGTLEGGRPAHGMIPGADAHGASPHGMTGDPAAAGASPHGTTADPTSPSAAPHAPLGPVDVKRVDRAAGPTGKTVAEVVAQRATLAGKTVRVHATVVKATAGVLGRTYLHLRDGSGDATAGTHDLAATTEATPAVGDIVVIEGLVAIDRDIGSGYKFPTIVEDAKILPAK
jgi:hypothetical protein